jgi:tetratricopeptide (TPR) repeat protein/transcriptional regulator with XRE-family HTH domain
METSTLIPFGELLKTYRKQKGLTQQQLARKLDIHQNTVGAWERGDYLPTARGMILEIARCLYLSEGETHHLLEASLLTVTYYWSLPSQRNPYFTGRQEVLRQLHILLAKEQNAISTRACALSGLAGIGKTQTAIEYAYRYALDYAAIFWANAETEESLLESFATIARTLKLPGPYTQKQEDVIALVQDWLTIHRDWLLVFDNVEECTLVQRFVPISRYGSLLLTTRLPTLGTLAHCMELQPLSVKESMQLLLSRAGIRPFHQSAAPMSTNEAIALQAIATSMGGLPLALDLTAAYIEESQCRFVEFLSLSRHDELQVLQMHPSSATYPRSVERTFTLAFERLQRQNPVAADLLIVCCFLAPDEIPEALLIRGASHLNVELEAMISDPFQLHMTFKDLLTYALLRRNTQTETLSVHHLVQTVLKEQMPEAVQRVWIERLIRLLDQLFLIEYGRKDTKHWAWYEQVLPHAHNLFQLAKHWQLVSSELGSLLCKVARYLFHKARYEQAEPLYLHAISVQERVLGTNHPDTAFSLNGLASLYCDLGRYEEAEALALRALSICEQNLESGHHILAISLENLARLAYQQGRYEEAEILASRAFSLRERNSRPGHPDIGLSLHLKANVYRAQCRYDQAESLYQYTLQLYQKSLEHDHIDIALLVDDFATLSVHLGRWEEAEQRYQEALRVWEKHQELDHPAHARCLEHYAELLGQRQREQEANSYRLQAREMQTKHKAVPQTTWQVFPASMGSEVDEDSETGLFETFLQECCVLSSQTSCRAADLWSTYQIWMQTHEKVIFLSRQAFTFQLKAKGCRPARTNTSRIWFGIELKVGSQVGTLPHEKSHLAGD